MMDDGASLETEETSCSNQSNGGVATMESTSVDETKLDVKSTGPLKTTITIKPSGGAQVKKSSSQSLLDKILSSDTPISLLDSLNNNGESESDRIDASETSDDQQSQQSDLSQQQQQQIYLVANLPADFE